MCISKSQHLDDNEFLDKVLSLSIEQWNRSSRGTSALAALRGDSEYLSLTSSCEQLDNSVDRVISVMVGLFQGVGDCDAGIWAMMKEAVGQGAADAFVEQEEQKGDADTFGREAVGVMMAVAFDEAVGFHLT